MKIIWKRAGLALCALVLVCSVAANCYLLSGQLPEGDAAENDGADEEIWNINFPDANSRDTYYSIHNLADAQKIGKGEGVKVGILDWGFGFALHDGLYAGGKDFNTWEYHDESFNQTEEHGFWMAQTLKEIAPEAEVYALGTYTPDNEDEWVDRMIEAIDWAIENKMDILTLSHEAISGKNRGRFDAAVNKAVAQGIVTTFIHYDNPDNILPWGIWSDGGGYRREADINIFQYDYNTMFMENYVGIRNNAEFDSGYKSELFLSVSSMSVVTGGFVAILKSINDTLTPAQYKEILVGTSYPAEYENDRAEHVADIGKAVQFLIDNYGKQRTEQ